ncbi:MAG: hypothetical protein HY831_04050, partial [Candidatus Aenigmarchaeota archaeon]|nr:hypothetical protein [Candidatus Aenigmarchaeota archaeon]
MDMDGIDEVDLEQFVEERMTLGTPLENIVEFAKRRFARNTDDYIVIDKMVTEHHARVMVSRIKSQGGSRQQA